MFTKFPTVAVKADGTKVPYEPGIGFTLPTGHWYIDISIPDVSQESVHCVWNAAFAATLNIQDSNLPDFKTPTSMTHDPDPGVDVAINDEAATNWFTEDPNTAYVPIVGSGNSVTNMTVTAGGSAAGACMFNLGNMASRRRRLKAVVTTAGVLRCHPHGVGA